MTTLSVRLPTTVHRELKKLSEHEGISLNTLIATAVAEKLSALEAQTILEERSRRGSREKFLAALQAVPDVAADARDVLE
jgi:predicted transcriptional regulator